MNPSSQAWAGILPGLLTGVWLMFFAPVGVVAGILGIALSRTAKPRLARRIAITGLVLNSITMALMALAPLLARLDTALLGG
jgi:hypothetical protein